MDSEQIQQRLDLLRLKLGERQQVRAQLEQQLLTLDQELLQRVGGIAELEWLLNEGDEGEDA